MGILRATILFGTTLLVVAIQCDALKAEVVYMTPEMKEQYDRFCQMQKERNGQQNNIKCLPAPEPAEFDVPPGFNRPHSQVQKPSEAGGTGLQMILKGKLEAQEWVKNAVPKKATISKVFQMAKKSAMTAAKNAAKGASSAYKNLKEPISEHEQPDLQNNQNVPYRPQPQVQPLPLPAAPPQPQSQQDMQSLPAPSLFRPSDNFNPALALGNYQGFQPAYHANYQEAEPDATEPKPSTKAEAKEARDALFYRTKELTRKEVLAYMDTLRRWPEYEQMKKLGRVPIDLDVLTRFNQTSEANCEDKKLVKSMEKMYKKLHYQESEHGKALVPFLKEVLDEQLQMCNFAQKSIDEFAEFAAQDPQRWEMIKLWNHKVGHYAKRHTNWGSEDQYFTNQIQMNEALTEMIHDQGLQSGVDRYQYGYKLILALKQFCALMDNLGETLSMTRLERNYKKNKTVKELHKLMSVCEQTKNSNYLDSLGSAYGR